MIFGYFIIDNALINLRTFRKQVRGIELPRRWWFFRHMSDMLGSYIGLLTAFSVQRVSTFLPVDIAWVVWIAPAVVGSVLIGRWMAHYRKRFDAPTAATVAAAVN